MAVRSWFVLTDGNRTGPFTDEQFREQIAQGRVTAETLVWADPMKEWARAADVSVPGLNVPGQPPATGGIRGPLVATGGQPGPAFGTALRTWPLLGRSLLLVIGQTLVIPSPWTTTSFYRWFVAELRLPNGKAVAFTGQPGDIWYIFMLSALCGFAGAIHYGLHFLLTPLSALFFLIIMRWFFANLAWEGRTEPLRFTGSYWGLLGWWLLGWLSLITIVGWAWVITALTRWVCRHVEGSSKQVSFIGTGWGVLWRTMAFGLACCFIIPIPWMMSWYTRWFVSQFCLTARM